LNEDEAKIAEQLLNNPSIQRIAGFQNGRNSFYNYFPILKAELYILGCFRTNFPKLYAEYRRVIGTLRANHPSLRQNFSNSVYPSITFNLGPKTICFLHRDAKNLAYGICAVTSLGSYDHRKGGHLVLWELKLILEFPPGATILIPSAAISHCNTSIQEGETRYSITQYCAGGLMRWVSYGCRSAATLKETDRGKDFLARFEKGNQDRCERFVGLFSKHGELAEDIRCLCHQNN